MRGKRANSTYDQLKPRNIPAYAGKTYALANSRNPFSEHPRVCGENGYQSRAISLPIGTSPRMRGKQNRTLDQPQILRNIPAYAGKTTPNSSQSSKTMEHPRVCGENASLPFAEMRPEGTSPRMRGKLLGRPQDLQDERNIPAYAGKTLNHVPTLPAKSEHPRVCGENIQDS